MRCSIKIIIPLIIFASCTTHEYKNSNAKNGDSGSGDTSKVSNVSGYPAAPAKLDSTGAQSGNMSNTFRDSVKQKK